MKFWKYHVNGNDFILVENEQVDVEWLCNRYTGIGADGILSMSENEKEIQVEYWNMDGSKADFCGNGICCVADILFRKQQKEVVQLLFGLETYEVYRAGKEVILKMPLPKAIGTNEYLCGVKHCVMEQGVKIEGNENYVEWLDDEHLMVETFEQGVGWTHSCGSGNIVSFYHWHQKGCINDSITCINPGGLAKLWIENEAIFYQVEPHFVYQGQIVL